VKGGRSEYATLEKTKDNKGKELWCCFVDFKKHFNTTPREKLWERLTKREVLNGWMVLILMLYETVKDKLIIA
jgi:hypothetical protein